MFTWCVQHAYKRPWSKKEASPKPQVPVTIGPMSVNQAEVIRSDGHSSFRMDPRGLDNL